MVTLFVIGIVVFLYTLYGFYRSKTSNKMLVPRKIKLPRNWIFRLRKLQEERYRNYFLTQELKKRGIKRSTRRRKTFLW